MKRFGRNVLAGCMILGLAASILTAGKGTTGSVQAAEWSTQGVNLRIAETEEDRKEPETLAAPQIPAAMSSAVDMQGTERTDEDAEAPRLQMAFSAGGNLDHKYGHRGDARIDLTNIGDTAVTINEITFSGELKLESIHIFPETVQSGASMPMAVNCPYKCPAGEHTEKLTVKYTTENGNTYTEDFPVPFKVAKVKLDTILGVELIMRRPYDGTTKVEMLNPGYFIKGSIVDGDDVKLSAAAEFDSKDAGNRTFSVTWSISGADIQNYDFDLSKYASVYIKDTEMLEHSVNTVTFGSEAGKAGIDQGLRTGTFTFPNLHIGEDPKMQGGLVWTDKEDGDEPVYLYKPQGSSDAAYKKELPQTPGVYTVRAEFPDTNNWHSYTTEADFEIYREMTGGKRNLKTGVAYQFGSGNWQVTGDSTVYRGGNNFYATSDREYEFTVK